MPMRAKRQAGTLWFSRMEELGGSRHLIPLSNVHLQTPTGPESGSPRYPSLPVEEPPITTVSTLTSVTASSSELFPL